MEPLTAWVEVTPAPKGNSQIPARNGRVRLLPSKRARRTQAALVKLLALHAPTQPLSGPVWRDATYVLPIPKSWPQWRQQAAAELREVPHTKAKGDTGNLAKLLDDALEQAGWLQDDGQIVGGTCARIYGPVAGYAIRITPLPDPATRETPGRPLWEVVPVLPPPPPR